jgi:hypothetical protein
MTNNTPIDHVQPIAQNTAAISGTLHRSDGYDPFYSRYSDQLSGFSGIWTFCGVAGQVFTAVEAELCPNDYDDGWIESIDAYVGFILEKANMGVYQHDIQTEAWLRPLAERAIKDNAVPSKPPEPNTFWVELVERREVEDGTHMWYMDDGSYTCKDRGDDEGIKEFTSFEEVEAFVKSEKFNPGEKVFVHEIDPDGMMGEAKQIKPLRRR